MVAMAGFGVLSLFQARTKDVCKSQALRIELDRHGGMFDT
jgi:hypothetical protein